MGVDMKRVRFLLVALPGVVGSLAASGCKNPEAANRTYFDVRIAPVLTENCINGTADNKCHVEFTDEDGNPSGQAMGNLDLSSFDSIKKRPELLSPYGSYPEAVLLMKAAKPGDITIQYGGETYESEIFHQGGGILSRDSEAFIELQTWLKNGATIDGEPPEGDVQEGVGDCSSALRPDVDPFLGQATGAGYDEFKSKVQPILADKCSFGTCHGGSQSDFYLACGDDEAQLKHNYVVSRSFVAEEPARSELLLRPLNPNAGGVGHSGGSIWDKANDKEFETLKKWAENVGPLEDDDDSPGFIFFSEQVLPVLLQRGCAMPQCHSPQGFNDFRLRAGSRGFFSPLAVRRNYEATLSEFISIDGPDPNESRVVKKNVTAANDGITHRAGITLLESRDDGGNPDVCEGQKDSDEGLSAYCTLVEWISIERESAVNDGLVSSLAEGETVPIIYVDRPANPDRQIEFANYRGDARLMRVDATLGPRGQLVSFGAPAQIDLSGCGAGGDYDVRGPEISYDGQQMVFALRNGESDGLNVYRANLDGSSCTQLTSDGGQTDSGVEIHNFDPVFIPDDPDHNAGGAIVFASTRPGALGRAHVSPRFKLPATNLWRMDLDGGGLEQMTFLNGSELSPAVMKNGQITMSTEKATDGFYQVSGRRINWDLTDYHPLLAQRDTIGFQQATEIREALDRDFWMILSDANAWFSGGSLAAFNRSVGPFEYGRDDTGFVKSVTFFDSANELAGKGSAQGAYRSPFPAPDGSVLVSYAAGNLDLTNRDENVDYDLVVYDPITDTRTMVAGDGDGRFQVEAVVAYARNQRHVFVNIPELVFGGTHVGSAAADDRAWAHFPDLPMLATLLGSNLRRGRDLEKMTEGDTLVVYKAEAPPQGASGDGTFQSWKEVGSVKLEKDDGSAFVDVPSGTPVIIELRKGDSAVFTMTEEHQFGPGEMTSLGVSRDFFDGVCGGCHGSTSGRELDVVVDGDALTGASISAARPEPSSKPSDKL
jgi:hypothetical protein